MENLAPTGVRSPDCPARSQSLYRIRYPAHTQYLVGNEIEKNEMGGACSAYGGRREAYRVLVGKPEGKRPLRKSRRRWEDNIKMDLQKVGCGGMDWIELTQDRDRWRHF